MSKPFIILFLCLQVFASVRAQTVFSKTYGDDAYQNGSALQLLPDGGMVIAGTTGFDQTDSADIALYRMNADGDLLWSVKAGGPVSDYVNNMILTHDQGTILTGQSIVNDPDSAIGALFVIKLDSLGNAEWAQSYDRPGIESGNAIRELANGDFLIAGSTSSPDSMPNGLLLKIDALGNLLWTKRFELNRSVLFTSLELSPTGSTGEFFVGGTAIDSLHDPNGDFVVLKLDSSGQPLWQFLAGGSGLDVVNALAPLADGGLYGCGTTNSGPSMNEDDGVLFKLDSLGNAEWVHHYNRTNDEGFMDLKFDQNRQEVYLCGSTTTSGSGPLPLILVTDDSGTVLQSRKQQAVFAEAFCTNLQLTDNGLLLTGQADFADALLVRTDRNGNSPVCQDSIIFLTADSLPLTGVGLLTTQSFSLTPAALNWTSQPFVDQFSTLCFTNSTSDVKEEPLLIFPNPSSTWLQARSSFDHITEWVVYSMTGEKLMTGKLQQQEQVLTIGLSTLANGVYLLELNSDDGVQRAHFIRQE